MKVIEITVPIPKSNQNKKAGNWVIDAGKRKADVRKAKRAAGLYLDSLSREEETALELPWDTCAIRVIWYHPTANHRDKWNMVGSLKGTIDGIVRAGILIDDEKLQPPEIESLTDKDNPRVVLKLIHGNAIPKKRFGGVI